MSRAARLIAAIAVALAVGLPLATGPVRAAGVSFGAQQIESVYGQGITFTVPVEASGPLARLEIRLRLPDSLGPFVEIVPFAAADRTATYHLDTTGDSHMVPNTTIEATWAAYEATGQAPVLSKAATIRYADTEHDWHRVKGDVVTVHWYAGDEAFANRALAIGDKAVKDTADLLGVDDVAPVDFFIYGDTQSFRTALGPGTRENVGGQAHTDIRTLFAMIGPDQINDPWVAIVVPHELIHIVFDEAVDNPFSNPPRWVNEGLAVYLSEGFTPTDRAAVTSSVRSGELMPLTALTAQFPTDPALTSLAYSESVSAIDHLVRTDGEDALLKLVESYAAGPTDDQAMQAATGLDVAGFQARWLADLGASEPIQQGPRPNPPGPVPPGWEGEAPGQPTAAPGETGAAPSSNPGPSASPAPGSTGSDRGGSLALVLAAVALVVVVVVVGLLIARRRTPAP